MMENDIHSGGLHQNRHQVYTRKQAEDARRLEFFEKVVVLNQQAQQEQRFRRQRRSASRATAGSDVNQRNGFRKPEEKGKRHNRARFADRAKSHADQHQGQRDIRFRANRFPMIEAQGE